jgi:hypothetical protein
MEAGAWASTFDTSNCTIRLRTGSTPRRSDQISVVFP